MAHTVMLDTSAVIALLKKGDETVISAIKQEAPEEVIISAITRFELEVATTKDKDKIAALPCVSASCFALSLAARMYSELCKKGKEPQLKDCFIAGCAIDTEAVLITLDNDFKVFSEFGLKSKIIERK